MKQRKVTLRMTCPLAIEQRLAAHLDNVFGLRGLYTGQPNGDVRLVLRVPEKRAESVVRSALEFMEKHCPKDREVTLSERGAL